MGDPEETANIERFPSLPRILPTVRKNVGGGMDIPPKVMPKHTLTPGGKEAVEFWHQGESASSNEGASPPKRVNHARRADQLGRLLVIVAVVVLTVTMLALKFTSKKYFFKSEEKEISTPVIDSYQGNNDFRKKDQKERDAKAGTSRGKGLMVQGASEDLQISLNDQIASMNEKLEKLRSLKHEETPIALPDSNGMIPKPLQQGP
jgi:hypothetical protein